MSTPLTDQEYARLAPECHGIVTIDGEQEPCDKPAVAVLRDPEASPWAACAYHAHRYGSGRMVPWVDLVAAERVRLLGKLEALADLFVEQGDEHVEGCRGQADCAACCAADLRALVADERGGTP